MCKCMVVIMGDHKAKEALELMSCRGCFEDTTKVLRVENSVDTSVQDEVLKVSSYPKVKLCAPN